MLAPILMFAVSVLGIIVLVGGKIYQQTTGAVLPFLAWRQNIEGVAVRYSTVVRMYIQKIHIRFRISFLTHIGVSLYVVFHEAIHDIKKTFTAPGHWLDRRTRNLVSLVRGRQQLSGRGTPSSYLRDINHR